MYVRHVRILDSKKKTYTHISSEQGISPAASANAWSKAALCHNSKPCVTMHGWTALQRIMSY
jgi:hypothetical protein